MPCRRHTAKALRHPALRPLDAVHAAGSAGPKCRARQPGANKSRRHQPQTLRAIAWFSVCRRRLLDHATGKKSPLRHRCSQACRAGGISVDKPRFIRASVRARGVPPRAPKLAKRLPRSASRMPRGRAQARSVNCPRCHRCVSMLDTERIAGLLSQLRSRGRRRGQAGAKCKAPRPAAPARSRGKPRASMCASPAPPSGPFPSNAGQAL